jgi:hypothetical protein
VAIARPQKILDAIGIKALVNLNGCVANWPSDGLIGFACMRRNQPPLFKGRQF